MCRIFSTGEAKTELGIYEVRSCRNFVQSGMVWTEKVEGCSQKKRGMGKPKVSPRDAERRGCSMKVGVF